MIDYSKITDQLRKANEKALKEAGDRGVSFARKLTQYRRYKLSDGKRLGYPYSRRRPRPIMDPEKLNRQSGDVYEGFYAEVDGDEVSIENESPNYEFIQASTKSSAMRMMARPTQEAIDAQLPSLYEKAINKFIDKIIIKGR